MHISKEPAMDEYLFISMAKLKSDRLRREREQRAKDEVPEPPKALVEKIPRAAAA
jgi:hypothetical protein